MFNLKLVLIAIVLFLGCVLAQSLQGDSLAREVAESVQLEEREETESWRWHEENKSEERKEAERQAAEREVKEGEKREKRAFFPPCQPPKGSTQRPTTAPTTRPTTAPTSRPPTSPTTRPTPTTPAPTQKATEKPTPKPTEKATPKPTEKATPAPTPKATSKPTNPPSNNYGLCDIVPGKVEPMKMLLPLYVYPGSTWEAVVSAASKIDIIAIVNPNSGPTATPSSAYTTYMNKLKTAGAEQVGYVYTSYASRSLSAVKADIDIYKNKYPHVIGIFFDEASNKAADVAYYRELYNYVLSKGYVHSILNPGVTPDAGYLDISTNIVVFEDYGSSVNSKSYKDFVKCAPNSSSKANYKYKFSGIAHTTSQSSLASYVNKFHQSGMGLVYITDGAGGCCTYNELVSYFAAEATAIAAINA
jgi:hypothetical protein